MTCKIAPSLLSAPLVNLGQVVADLEAAGADIIHFDVEDGTFVPELNLGIKLIPELRPLTDLPFDVHLMVQKPEWLIHRLATWGADMISVHYEACPYPRRILGLLKSYGIEAGLAFNPATPLPDLSFCKPLLDFVVILSTEPEHNQCPYLPAMLDKLQIGHEQNSGLTWVLDGGVTSDNVADAAASGADIVVSGRGVFGTGTIKENMSNLRRALKQSLPG